jgi:hypothetical protein
MVWGLESGNAILKLKKLLLCAYKKELYRPDMLAGIVHELFPKKIWFFGIPVWGAGRLY